MTEPNLRRMWINQPSTLQPHHDLHGTCVLALAQEARPGTTLVWHIKGDIVSQEVVTSALSVGWPSHLKEETP